VELWTGKLPDTDGKIVSDGKTTPNFTHDKKKGALDVGELLCGGSLYNFSAINQRYRSTGPISRASYSKRGKGGTGSFRGGGDLV